MIDYRKLANLLLDTICDIKYCDEVASLLYDAGFSNDDLISLGFEPVEEDDER